MQPQEKQGGPQQPQSALQKLVATSEGRAPRDTCPISPLSTLDALSTAKIERVEAQDLTASSRPDLSAIRDAFTSALSHIEQQINSAKPPDFIGLLTQTSQLSSTLDREIVVEQAIETKLEALHAIVEHLERAVLKPLQSRYQSATGLLDSQSRVAQLSWGLSALASLGLAAGLALTYEHAILHGVSHIVHEWLGYSALSYVASAATQAGVLVAQGVACFVGALVGPSLLALVKTAGGRGVRAISATQRERFDNLARQAKQDLADYRELTSHLAEALLTVEPRLAAFYARNEDVRALISSRLDSLSCDPDAISVADHTELHKRSAALGESERVTLMRCLNLERKLHELSYTDFRSPELIDAVSEAHHGQGQIWGLSRGLRLTAKSFVSLFHSARTIGERSALDAARSSRDTFENLPQNPVTDILSGMGSGVSTTLEQALRAGTQPGKTTYSFLKGVLGLSKGLLVGGEKEGPRLETLLKVMFDLPELEKGNRIRFVSKLIPSLIRAATQKPIIMEQAELAEELDGKVSPKGIQTKIAEKEGTFAVSKKMLKDLGSLALTTSQETLLQYGYVIPLQQLRTSTIVQSILPTTSRWAAERLNAYDESNHRKLSEKMQRELEQLPHPEMLVQLQDNELDVHVIEKFIEYSYRPRSTISQREISALLRYWEFRRKAAWHEAADVQARHSAELAKLHPQFPSLRKILHAKSNLFSSVTRGLLFGKATNEDEQLTPHEVLTAAFTAWSTPLEGRVKPEAPTILDAAADGMHVVLLDQEGKLRLLKAGEVRALWMKSCQSAPLTIVEHADHARVTVYEMICAMKLEPFQRRAFIETHHALSSGALSYNDACDRLTRASFPTEQLRAPGAGAIVMGGLLGPCPAVVSKR